MADKPTTREETYEKINRKENLQQFAQKLAGDIFFLQLWSLLRKNVGQRRPKRRTLETGAESSRFHKKSKMLETHLVKINKPNGQMKAVP